MKKIICLFLALTMLALLCACGASSVNEEAETETTQETVAETPSETTEETESTVTEETETETAAQESVSVYVTIADEGELVVACESVDVYDTDGDGMIGIGDALYCAHEEYYDGGAQVGYQAEETEYGISLTMLWGLENGGSYGYYLNDVSAWSLADPVAEGDHVYAFSYVDLQAWSDAYCYFDTLEAENDAVLTLSYLAFDENWQSVVTPLANATITVDGESTRTASDENGCVTLSLSEPGRYVISAVCEDMTITPPVCILTVE